MMIPRKSSRYHRYAVPVAMVMNTTTKRKDNIQKGTCQYPTLPEVDSHFCCPSCRQPVGFPFYGLHLRCPYCGYSEPLYDFPISQEFHRWYTEYNLGLGVFDGN